MKQNIAGTNLIEGIGTMDEQRESRPNDEKVYILKNVEQGAKLCDGLPLLTQILSCPRTSIPSIDEHGNCLKEVRPFYIIPGIFEMIKVCKNHAWLRVRKDNLMNYVSECDLAVMIINYFNSFIDALNLRLDILHLMVVTHVRSDVIVFVPEDDSNLMGVVLVKAPGIGVLEEPTVIGEIFDLMKLCQLVYGMGPTLGMVTTGAQAIVCWFPEDDHADVNGGGQGRADEHKKFPSQRRGPSVLSTMEGEIGGKKCRNKVSIEPVVKEATFVRKLSCTRTIDTATEGQYLGEVVATYLTRMTFATRTHDYCRSSSSSPHDRPLLRFHRGSLQKFTWGSISKTQEENIPFDKFPAKDVLTLLALEDLEIWWRQKDLAGHYGVLQRGLHAKLVSVVEWSGSFAVMTPYFATIQEPDRESYREKIRELLERIHSVGYYHVDVHWRHMGCYRGVDDADNCSSLHPILLDLIYVAPLADNTDPSWIAEGLSNLFPSPPPVPEVGIDGERPLLVTKNNNNKEDQKEAIATTICEAYGTDILPPLSGEQDNNAARLDDNDARDLVSKGSSHGQDGSSD
eukprot:gene30622-39892_t